MTEQRIESGVPHAGAGTDETGLRERVAGRLAAGAAFEAMNAARDLLETFPGRRTHRFLRGLADRDDPQRSALKPLNVALLASFSIEFLHDPLVALGLAAGYKVSLYQGAFATFRQEILAADSGLHASAPDAVILAVEAEDWTPAAFDVATTLREGALDAVVAGFENELRGLVAAYRARHRAPLLIHNLALPAHRTLGLMDAKAAQGQGALLLRMNETIAKIAREAADVHVVDYAGLVNRHGALNWYDERMRLYARAPVAGAMLPHLAAEYVKLLRALAGGTKKCLVVDLDNTLWGGIVGEDGAHGIALGSTYPGSAYAAFQRHLAELRARGVVLAIASKNNEADVDEVLREHPSMILRAEHFAAREVHWEPKSESLKRIASTLALGLEHLVFVDDNPAECEEVRRALPQVHVIALPEQPERFVAALQRDGLFDTLSLSDEDLRRGEMYRQRSEAEAVRGRMASVEDYYRDLAMEIDVAPIVRTTLPRASQLFLKTNQFNVTTRRYAEAELAERLSDRAWTGFTVAVRDRFGDHGIVGVALARAACDALEIDSLLMSCRVIGRGVETAMLAQLCDEAATRGLASVHGLVVATAKNAPARDLFERHGFARRETTAENATAWSLDVTRPVRWPDWFRRTSRDG